MTLYIVPQLPVKDRYQEYWIKWWREDLESIGADFEFLFPDDWDGEAYEFRANSREYFAPVPESIVWEAKITEKLAEKLPEMRGGDYVLFLDFDFTGMFHGLLPLLKRYNDKVRFGAYVHAGSWDDGDYFDVYGISKSKGHIEYGAALLMDHLFFPSEYEGDLMVSRICSEMHSSEEDRDSCKSRLNKRKVIVGTVWKPYKKIMYALKRKLLRIVNDDLPEMVFINGRLDSLIEDTVESAVKYFRKTGEEVYATDPRVAEKYGLKVVDYYDALSRARIMLQPKRHESFGLAVLEALFTFTVPMLNAGLEDLYRKIYGESPILVNPVRFKFLAYDNAKLWVMIDNNKYIARFGGWNPLELGVEEGKLWYIDPEMVREPYDWWRRARFYLRAPKLVYRTITGR